MSSPLDPALIQVPAPGLPARDGAFACLLSDGHPHPARRMEARQVCREVEGWFDLNPALFRLDWLFRDNTWVCALPPVELDGDPCVEAWMETMEEKVQDWLESVRSRFPALFAPFMVPLGRHEMTRDRLDAVFSKAYNTAFGMGAWERDNVGLVQHALNTGLPAAALSRSLPRL